MSHNTKNYFDDGGDTLVIGGKLVVEDGAEVEGLEGGGSGSTYVLPVATSSTLGGVKIGQGLAIDDGVLSVDGAAAISDSTADSVETLVTDFNALLAALRTAGLLKASV